MTTTSDSHADPDDSDRDRDRDEQSTERVGIDDSQLPEDLQPSEDNPLAMSPDESSEAAAGDGGMSPDPSATSGGQSDDPAEGAAPDSAGGSEPPD